MAVVRAEEEAPQVGRRDRAAIFGDVARRRALAQVDVHAAGGLFRRFGGAGALVVCGDARRDVGVQSFPFQPRGVPVDELARGARALQLSQRLRVLAQHTGRVHEFSEAEEGVPLQQRRRLLPRKACAARLEGCGGHAGGQHQLHFERGILRGAGDVLRAVDAADVDDLVRVGDDGSRAAGHDQPRELLGRELRALDMDVRIDQAGHGDLAADVVLALPLVRADARDLAAGDGDVAALHLTGEHVDECSVFEHDVGRRPAQRDVDEPFDHGTFSFAAIIPHPRAKEKPRAKIVAFLARSEGQTRRELPALPRRRAPRRPRIRERAAREHPRAERRGGAANDIFGKTDGL